MKLTHLLFMLWAAITLAYVIPSAAKEPTNLLSFRSSQDKSSSSPSSPPPPYTLHAPAAVLKDRGLAASTKTLQNRQGTTTDTPPPAGTGGQKFSIPQIFAISFACVMGATVLGCMLWICFGKRN